MVSKIIAFTYHWFFMLSIRSRYLFNAKTIAIAALIAIIIISIIIIAVTIGSGGSMSEIEKAAKVQRNVFIVYIILLAGTVIFSVFVWITSNKYQDIIKADADSKIESSKAESAKANTSVAGLTVRSEELKTGILKMEKEVADARRGQAEAQRSLLELQESLKPRHLTNKQRIQLIDSLAKHPTGNVAISCMGSSSESCNFADEIRNLLKNSDWKIDGGIGHAMTIEGQQPSGIVISIQSQNSPSSHLAAILQEELNKMGFDVKGKLEKHLPENKIELLVGLKP